jgi:hypothetical protein
VERLAVIDGMLPAACDAFLAPPDSGDPCAGRAWFEATLRHALPHGAEAAFLCIGGVVLLPLQAQGRRLGSLTTPYSLAWRPLAAVGAGEQALRAAGEALGRHLRWRPPARLEALDPTEPGIAPFLEGLGTAGLVVLRYDHFALWEEALSPGTGWEAYLETRAPALRNTIRRKLARGAARLAFTPLAEPGPALEAGLADFVSVRARSWKPDEPFADFDAALMRALAATGELRLGLLHAGERPVAAQYWIVSGGRAIVPKLFHDEAARAASPGTVLTALMIRRLLEEDRVHTLDFGRGDDAYKRLWVGTRRPRIGALALDPRHPEGAAALVRHAAGRLRRRLVRGGMGS